MVTQSTILTGVAVLAVLLGAVLNHVAHTKAGKVLLERLASVEHRAVAAEERLVAWYDAHTTPAERAVIDGVARAAVADLQTRYPGLEQRVGAIEAALPQFVTVAAEAAAAASPAVPPKDTPPA